MQPIRPEGGGRHPQAPKPTAPNITEILTHREEAPSPEQLRKKKRTLALLIVLSVLSVALALYLTFTVVGLMPTI